MKKQKSDIRLTIAQKICHSVASGQRVTKEELEFSFAMAEKFGDDAVWQQRAV